MYQRHIKLFNDGTEILEPACLAELIASAGLIDSDVKLGLYFVHERIWNYIPLGRPKRPEYEI